MPKRLAAGIEVSRHRASFRQLHMTGPIEYLTTLLLFILLFLGVSAETNDERSLFRFLDNVLPNYTALYNTTVPACEWPEITCIDRGQKAKIWSLNFSGRGLNGTILPGTLGALTSLTNLDLSHNLLSGEIPEDIFNLSSLTHLKLANNKLGGGLPDLVSNLVQLGTLDLSQNMLSGPLPQRLDSMFLNVLDLHSNNFSGRIPSMLSLPNRLQTLDLSSNQLIGEVNHAYENLSQLKYLNLSRNLLTEALPGHFDKLGALRFLDFSSNRFYGSIPDSLTKLPELIQLSLANNRLTGPLPPLPWGNGDNHVLMFLDCSNNLLNGSIPEGLLASANLEVVRLAGNNFTGPLPVDFSAKLRELDLQNNNLNGSIPQKVTTLRALQKLELSSNHLGGNIPWNFFESSSLQYLGLGRNSFEGGPLLNVTSVAKILHLNLSSCKIKGSIPDLLAASLDRLQCLDLSHNHLNGSIPSSLFYMTTLEYLDLSFNKLTGAIPSTLTELPSLRYLNFSYNNLTGEVPRSGFNSSSFQGNPELCGLILTKSCPGQSPETPIYLHLHRRRHRVGAIAGIVIGTIVSSCSFVIIALFLYKRKPKKLPAKEVSKYLSEVPMTFEADSNSWAVQVPHPGSIPVIMFEKPLLNLTFADLLRATSIFHKDNQISDGHYGPSYKGALPGGLKIVVKVLFLGCPANEYEKVAQLEALGKIRHPNLLSLMGYCLVGGERLLVYEFMENGDVQRRLHELPEVPCAGNQDPEDWSKDTWEHSDSVTKIDDLSWPVRYRIALGVARALAFLHHNCSPQLVHRDVTSSNILLDSLYEPHLADYGLASLITSENLLETPAICGAPGYLPPEYGQAWKATTRGDVYSFGVVLLELVTGKRPIGHFHDSLSGHLVGWVRSLMREKRAYKCLDPKLACTGVENEMLETLRIGYLCTAELPSKRPTMQQIVGLLKDTQPKLTNS